MEAGKEHPIDSTLYEPPQMMWWRGRIDGPKATELRWHQHIQPIDLNASSEKTIDSLSIVLLGLACDEGVKRNGGRIGAAGGPAAIRSALCNLPIFYPNIPIYDAGNIRCVDGDLETAQAQLAAAITDIFRMGAFPILLGGGHEITYGHYQGILQFFNNKPMSQIGIVNFDAHFDNREPPYGRPNSGTGFWQIDRDCINSGRPFHYLALGIQKASNTPLLFEAAHRSNTRYVLATHFQTHHSDLPKQYIRMFSNTADRLYVTIDMDVFAAPYAPGVSAPAYNGIPPDAAFFDCLDELLDTGKVVSLDIAEVNPDQDIDNRTAKLAASIIFHVLEKLARINR